MPERSDEEIERLNALWQDLWNKHETLIDFLQRMNEIDPAERPDSEGAIRNAELEVQRIEVLMNSLYNVQTPPFPTDAQVAALRDAVGKLQQAISRSSKANVLIRAATAVVKTWPVSQGG